MPSDKVRRGGGGGALRGQLGRRPGSTQQREPVVSGRLWARTQRGGTWFCLRFSGGRKKGGKRPSNYTCKQSKDNSMAPSKTIFFLNLNIYQDKAFELWQSSSVQVRSGSAALRGRQPRGRSREIGRRFGPKRLPNWTEASSSWGSSGAEDRGPSADAGTAVSGHNGTGAVCGQTANMGKIRCWRWS